jgi:hypothetical protein
VIEACYLLEEKMTKDHRRLAEEVVQGVLLDDSAFLARDRREGAPGALLEAEMDICT